MDIAPGDLIWIPPNTLHEMYGDGPASRLQYIHFDLLYDPSRSHWEASVPGGTTDLSLWPERMHPPIHDPVIKTWCGKLPRGTPSFVTDILRRIILEFDRKQSSGLGIAGLVVQLIDHLLKTQPDSQLTAKQARTVENCMYQIKRNSHQKLNSEAIARQHGLSATHFRKLFREHFSQNPREAHCEAKMRTACDYLTYSEFTISEIASRLDFTNVHNFSRAFRKAIGHSPRAYRKG